MLLLFKDQSVPLPLLVPYPHALVLSLSKNQSIKIKSLHVCSVELNNDLGFENARFMGCRDQC